MSEMAILFADVCGSTKLYEKHGDERARKLIARSIELMSAATAEHGGALIKTIGDEVMCRFPSADQAAAAALDMQERVSGAALTGGGLNLSIHVGFHFGPVVEEEGDVFGDAVNVAARMVNLAKADQVVTTGATMSAMSEKYRKGARQIDRTEVKGKSEKIEVFELLWQEGEATRMVGRAPWEIPLAVAPGKLVITQGAHEIEISESHPSVTVGRGDQNDLVMKGELVSRLHARIEYRNGRFSLTDQSTNGTYVADAAGRSRLVRHDSQVLSGSGAIALGHTPQSGQPDVIHYRLAA
jgi:class 3 adenylate cyclase